MEAVIDSAGRILVPKAMREALGLLPGSTVDVSRYGDGLHIRAEGRTARLVREGDRLVADTETPVTDEILFGLLEAGRR